MGWKTRGILDLANCCLLVGGIRKESCWGKGLRWRWFINHQRSWYLFWFCFNLVEHFSYFYRWRIRVENRADAKGMASLSGSRFWVVKWIESVMIGWSRWIGFWLWGSWVFRGGSRDGNLRWSRQSWRQRSRLMRSQRSCRFGSRLRQGEGSSASCYNSVNY